MSKSDRNRKKSKNWNEKMGMFSKFGLKAAAFAAVCFVASFGFGANQAEAGCRFVQAPCGQSQPAQNYYEQNSESQNRRDEVTTHQTDNGYDQGYQDGVRAVRTKARAHTTKHKATARRSSTHRASTQTRSKQRVTAQRSINRATARTSRNYRSTQATRTRRTFSSTYVMPIKDHATTYGASAVGYSVPVAAFAGRGESWVSGHGQIIRYSTPHQISVQNGQNCGWGMGIAQSGQRSGNRAWVCHCEHGWQPPH